MISWPYIAGFLDGDGWVTRSKNKNCNTYRYTIGLTQKSDQYKSMKSIFMFLKMHGINGNMFKRDSHGSIKGITEMINIYITNQSSLIRLANFLIPHLLIKKDKMVRCEKDLSERRTARGLGTANLSKAGKKWSRAEERILLKMRKDKYSFLAISDRLNRKINTLYKKYFRLNK